MIKIKNSVMEVHSPFLVWICEVCKYSKISIKEVSHVKIGYVECGTSYVKPWISWAKYKIDDEDC